VYIVRSCESVIYKVVQPDVLSRRPHMLLCTINSSFTPVLLVPLVSFLQVFNRFTCCRLQDISTINIYMISHKCSAQKIISFRSYNLGFLRRNSTVTNCRRVRLHSLLEEEYRKERSLL
jgi:hypothetical protein